MRKYEVYATVWDSTVNAQVEKCKGTFEDYICARLFADAYSNHYSSTARIVEYKAV